MTLRKRGQLYLMRKRGRTLLLLLFLFISASLLQIGGSLKSNADQEEETLRKSLGSGFMLKSDMENEAYYELRSKAGIDYKFYTGPIVTDEMIQQILKIDGVVDYEISLLDFVCVDLKLKAGAWADLEPYEYITETDLKLLCQKTTAHPCRNGERNKNFWTGAYSISYGRNIQEGDHYKAVISEWLAKENNLKVGDSFKVETKEGFFLGSKDPLKTLGEPVELEIVGLFQPNFKQEESEQTFEDGYVVNLIYTDMDTHTTLQKNAEEREPGGDGYEEVTFFVEDPEKLDSVMQQIREDEEIGIEGLLFQVDDTAYQASVRPFRQISLFSTVIVVIGVIGMGTILYLLMKLWIRGRSQEVGVLLSVGIGKRKIIGQMLLECLIVSAAALLLSFALSGPLTKECTRAVEQMNSPKTEREAYVVRLTYGTNPKVEKSLSDEVHLDYKIPGNIRLLTILIVCGISCFSVLLGSIQLLDIEPKKLLQSGY